VTVILRIEAPFCGHYELHRLTFGVGSPTVAIVAGLHGNELNSIHATNMLINALRIQRPRGTVHVFPLVNTFGADAGRKRWPFSNQDINRAFPGSADGTSVERIAHALLAATADADVCIDAHSGAPHVREIPQVRVPLSGAELELGRATGLPVIWRRPGSRLHAGGLVAAWRRQGQKAFRIVGGRGITLDTRLATSLARGLSRLLAHLGVVSAIGEPETVADIASPDIETHRAPCGGLFASEVRVGDTVQPGHLLGHLSSPIGGDRLAEIRAQRPGVVMTVRAWPMVHAQELLVRVAGRVRE